jgi:hypothetical protein
MLSNVLAELHFSSNQIVDFCFHLLEIQTCTHSFIYVSAKLVHLMYAGCARICINPEIGVKHAYLILQNN